MRVAIVALELVPLGGEASLQLRDHSVDGGEVLDRARGERAIELVERALGREARGALDQVSLELTPQVLLEFSQLISRTPSKTTLVQRYSCPIMKLSNALAYLLAHISYQPQLLQTLRTLSYIM